MKKLKDIFEATLDLNERYSIGDSIAFDVDGHDDTGVITKVIASGYTVKSNLDGKSRKVPEKSVAYMMDAGNGLGADAAADAIADGQVSA
jgi:hypothetical protein